MKTVEDKEKFIELRASGMSFAKIAQEIGVSKPTLVKWSLEYSKDIENRRFLAVEELMEQYKLLRISRIRVFGEVLSKAINELQNRDFSLVSFKDLLVLISQLEGKLLQEGGMIRYVTDQRSSYWESMDEDQGPIKIELFDQK